ncbi:MAG TPA: prolipoprotein diacylglyceryl transferase [Cytophagaceae bacterium]|jgi:phosphatidylglycerol:prolipoprotein diacylglycerol transferase|nr:prolipoprotein diacylglyceryl transferase [Cytophagaceae bacterium]
MLNFIIWNVSPELFSIGRFEPRWYGPLFALGFFVGQYILTKIYKIEGRPQKEVETLTIYMVLATIIGARLGHCLFYEPDYFLAHPLEILFIWQGGLASHGAGIAILFSIWLYCRNNPGQHFLYVMDRIAITVALAACFIRLGNLTNSEIVGIPANVPQAFVFVNPTASYLEELDNLAPEFKTKITNVKIIGTGKDTTLFGKYVTSIELKMRVKNFENKSIMEVAKSSIRQAIFYYNTNKIGEYNSENSNIILSEAPGSYIIGDENKNGTEVTIKAWGIPRHPAQLYESISSLALFMVLLFVYSRFKEKTPEGLLFGIFMVWIFTLRFFYEYIKENQVAFENDMSLNMGQLLSIPMVIIGLAVLVRSLVLKKN